MKVRQLFLPMLLLAGTVYGTPLNDARLRLGQVATRAIANFRSSDSIAARLEYQGITLHPELIGLRLRVEAALDEAEAAIDKGDVARAGETLERANALLDRFARRIGGD